MTRRVDYLGGFKALVATTAVTHVWTSSEIPSNGIVAYGLYMDGTGNTIADIDRVRLKANGSDIINLSMVQLRAFLQSFSGGTLQLPTTATGFILPLMMLDAPMPRMQDVSQFPINSQVQLEVVFNTGVAAGGARVFWIETDVAPQVFPRILGSTMNIGASVAQQRWPIQENGEVRGISVPQTGLRRMKIALGNREYTLISGEDFGGLTIHNALLQAWADLGLAGSSATRW